MESLSRKILDQQKPLCNFRLRSLFSFLYIRKVFVDLKERVYLNFQYYEESKKRNL